MGIYVRKIHLCKVGEIVRQMFNSIFLELGISFSEIKRFNYSPSTYKWKVRIQITSKSTTNIVLRHTVNRDIIGEYMYRRAKDNQWGIIIDLPANVKVYHLSGRFPRHIYWLFFTFNGGSRYYEFNLGQEKYQRK